MADDQKAPPTQQNPVVVPDEVKQRFPDLVPMVLASKSMDDDERNYWFSMLPIMTEDQVKELRDILESEQKRIQADAKKDAVENMDVEAAEKARLAKRDERIAAEKAHQDKALSEAERLLDEELDNAWG